METTIHKCVHRDNFAKISNALLQNNKLSLKARGLLAYVMSLPNSWVLHMNHLYENCSAKDGRTAIQSAIKELIKYGYVSMRIERDAKGLITGRKYFAFDDPSENYIRNPLIKPSNQVSRQMDNPSDGKPATIKKDSKKEIEYKETFLADGQGREDWLRITEMPRKHPYPNPEDDDLPF